MQSYLSRAHRKGFGLLPTYVSSISILGKVQVKDLLRPAL